MPRIVMMAAALVVSLLGLPITAVASEQPAAERPASYATAVGPTASGSRPIFDLDMSRLMVRDVLDDRDVR